MIFDTHCHYNLEPLFPNWQEHWQKAQVHGVEKSVVVGSNIETSTRAINIAKHEKNLWCSVAIHPIEFDEREQSIDTLQQKLTELLKQLNSKIIAIGETGLDYFHVSHETGMTEERKHKIISQQHASLRMHTQLAQSHGLPLILHVRDQAEQAYWDTLQLLEEENYTGKFILHCVSGPTAYVQKALQMGAYVSAAGNTTYKNAEHLRDLVRLVPEDRLLVETDAPYLPPQQFRGQTCEPWMISLTAQYLQEELTISPEKTRQNADAFFDLG